MPYYHDKFLYSVWYPHVVLCTQSLLAIDKTKKKSIVDHAFSSLDDVGLMVNDKEVFNCMAVDHLVAPKTLTILPSFSFHSSGDVWLWPMGQGGVSPWLTPRCRVNICP
jgi:hypothetical protein